MPDNRRYHGSAQAALGKSLRIQTVGQQLDPHALLIDEHWDAKGGEGLHSDMHASEDEEGKAMYAVNANIRGILASPRPELNSDLQLAPRGQLASPRLTSRRPPSPADNANGYDNAGNRHANSEFPDIDSIYAYALHQSHNDFPTPPSYREEKELKRLRLAARLKSHAIRNIHTMHKRVADKIHPINADVSMTDGSKADVNVNWKQECLRKESLIADGTGSFDQRYLTKRFLTIQAGSRLTPERLANITTGLELMPTERHLLECLLMNREAVLAYTFEHLSKVRPEVAPPQQIRTLPHEPWQHPGFKLNPLLRHVVEGMLRKRL